MKVLRLQNKTPSVYTQESRDFQLFTRLYDCVCNGILYDGDSITEILSSKNCRSSMLPLLQTKLGFFTYKDYDDSSIRSVLEGFPVMLKYKGSIKAITYAINAFLKLNNIFSPVTVIYQKEPMLLSNGYMIPECTLVIGIQSALQDTSLLEEVFRYILPAGIGYYFYFYSSLDSISQLLTSDTASILYVSDNLNSQIRFHTFDEYEQGGGKRNRLTGAVDTMSLLTDYYVDDVNIDALGDVIPTATDTRPRYGPGIQSLFLGVHYGSSTVNNYVTNELNVTPVSNNAIVYNNEHYVYDNSSWKKLRFMGNVISNPTTTYPNSTDSVNQYDVVYNLTQHKYYIYDGSAWQQNSYPIYLFEDSSDNQ